MAEPPPSALADSGLPREATADKALLRAALRDAAAAALRAAATALCAVDAKALGAAASEARAPLPVLKIPRMSTDARSKGRPGEPIVTATKRLSRGCHGSRLRRVGLAAAPL
jgi:hypothetical protein